MSTEKAIFGAGCFWGVEARFAELPGVLDTTVGYAGGDTTEPTYEQVCSRDTGHAEVVEVTYDPDRLPYTQLLDAFFSQIAPPPPSPHRLTPGPDRGQYRSVVFTTTDAQADEARARRDALDASGRFAGPLLVEIAPVPVFWRAEEYHQRYLEKRNLLP